MSGLRLLGVVAALGLGVSSGACSKDSSDLAPPVNPSNYRVVHQSTSTECRTKLLHVGPDNTPAELCIGPKTSGEYGRRRSEVHLMGALPDGSAVVLAIGGQLYRLDVDDGSTPHPLTTDVQDLETFSRVAIDRRGTRLAYLSANEFYVVPLRGGGAPTRVAARDSGTSMDFSGDGRFLLTGAPRGAVHVAVADGSGERGLTARGCEPFGARHYLACEAGLWNLETMAFVPSTRGARLVGYSDPYAVLRHSSGTVTRLDMRDIDAPEVDLEVGNWASAGSIAVAGDRLLYLALILVDLEHTRRTDLIEASLTNPGTPRTTLLTDLGEDTHVLGADAEATYTCEGARLLRVAGAPATAVVLSENFLGCGEARPLPASGQCRRFQRAFADCIYLTQSHIYFSKSDEGFGAVPLTGGAFTPLTPESRWLWTERGVLFGSSEEVGEIWETDPTGRSTRLGGRNATDNSAFIHGDWVFRVGQQRGPPGVDVTRVGSGEPLRPWVPQSLWIHSVLGDHAVYQSSDDSRLRALPLTSPGPERLLTDRGNWRGSLQDSAKVVVSERDSGLWLVDMQGERESLSNQSVDTVVVNSATSQIAWREDSRLWLYEDGEREELAVLAARNVLILIRFRDGGRYLSVEPQSGTSRAMRIIDTQRPERVLADVPAGLQLQRIRAGRVWVTQREEALIGLDLETGAEKARFEGPRGLLWHPTARWVGMVGDSGTTIIDLDGGLSVIDERAGYSSPERPAFWTTAGTRLVWYVRTGEDEYDVLTYTLASGQLTIIAEGAVNPRVYPLPNDDLLYTEDGRLFVVGIDGQRSPLTSPQDPDLHAIIGISTVR